MLWGLSVYCGCKSSWAAASWVPCAIKLPYQRVTTVSSSEHLCTVKPNLWFYSANYLVTTVAWLSFLRKFKECGACKTFCARLVKFTQVSAPTGWMLLRLHSQNLHSKDSHATVVTKYFATITTLFLQCEGIACIRSMEGNFEVHL